jgi:hypothetical protein
MAVVPLVDFATLNRATSLLLYSKVARFISISGEEVPLEDYLNQL